MEQKKSTEKKAYRTPELRAYGDVSELTRTATSIGARDGGVSPKNRS